MGASHSSEDVQSAVANAKFSGFRVPDSFQLYVHPSWRRKVTLHIGTSKSDPMYFLSVLAAYNGDLVLHNGPTADAPPLASAASHDRRSSHNTINLPPLGPGLPPVQVQFEMNESWTSGEYVFKAPAGTSDPLPVYQFEWKRSSQAGGGHLLGRNSGWKLVRSDLPDEMLAVWTNASSIRNKGAKFKFLNSAAAGALGDPWRLIAVMTFIKLWQKITEHQSSTAATTAAASG